MRHRTIICLVGILFVTAVAVGAMSQEQSAKPADPELDAVQGMIRQAWQESEQFTRAGGKASDANHPGRKWAVMLWQYREQHPGIPAAARATGEALHLMIHTDQIKAAIAKADTLKPDDPSWKRVISVLLEAGDNIREYDFLIKKTNSLLPQIKDKEVRAAMLFNLGQAHQRKDEGELAKAAYQAVIVQSPNTPYSKEAEGNIHEIESLNVGQPGPLFANKSTEGARILLSDFKGKVVLLKFWASW